MHRLLKSIEKLRGTEGWMGLAAELTVVACCWLFVPVYFVLDYFQEKNLRRTWRNLFSDWDLYKKLTRRDGLIPDRGSRDAWCPWGLRVSWEPEPKGTDSLLLGRVLSDTAWVLAGGTPLRGEWVLVDMNSLPEGVIAWGSREHCETEMASRILLAAA